MSVNRKSDQDSKPITHITAGSRLEGKIKTSDNVRIDGEFFGDIEVTGKLVTGEGSFIKGKISAIDVVIGGRVEANVKGIWSVTIQSTGHLKGDLSTEELTIERGACFVGACAMDQEKVANPSEELVLQEA